MAVNVWGNSTGPVYPFGKSIVAVSGTPVALSSAGTVPLTTGFGTSASKSPIVCNQIVFQANPSNTGNVYVLLNGGDKTKPNSWLAILQPGQSFTLGNGSLTNTYNPQLIQVDADTSADWLIAFGIIM